VCLQSMYRGLSIVWHFSTSVAYDNWHGVIQRKLYLKKTVLSTSLVIEARYINVINSSGIYQNINKRHVVAIVSWLRFGIVYKTYSR